VYEKRKPGTGGRKATIVYVKDDIKANVAEEQTQYIEINFLTVHNWYLKKKTAETGPSYTEDYL
jgi:hypothetical protein